MRLSSGSRVWWTLLALFGSVEVAEAQTEGEGAVPRSGAGAIVRERPAPEGNKKKAVVVPPELLKFESAAYPREAEVQGLQADVVLKLTIDAEGKVTAADVTQPAGHGFDAAAQAAALRFQFRPATRDGRPVPSQILYRYSFTLTPVAPAEPEPPANTGELVGTVRIADTDSGLAGSEVVVTLPDGSERQVSTDGEGRFRLTGVPSGRYRVRVATAGFRPLDNQEEVRAGEATEVVYRVVPEATGIEILVEGERPAREVTRRTIERREIERIPGTGGDALRSIQSLPGIARAPGLSGLLLVRGSAPNDTNVFVDGSWVPLIYHFGGLSSVVPTELLERIDFYPGNFSARYGRVSGGIIDVGLRAPDTRCVGDYGKATQETGCYHGLVQVDLIDARTLIQGPIGNSKEWSFAVAGRRSWLDAWLGPVLDGAGASVTTAPVYYDYQGIVERRSGKSRLSLRAYGADDRLEILIKDPAAEDPGFGGNLVFGTAFYRVQALYEDELSSAVSINSMLSGGKNSINFALGGNFVFTLDSFPFYGRHEFGFRLADGVKANLGLDFLLAPYDLVIRASDPPREGEPDPGPFAARPVREQREKGSIFRPSWYGELELTPTPRLRVVPGVRVDYARDSGHADFSPRINARYDLVTAANAEEQANGVRRRRTTVKGGLGMFYQPPDFQETDEVFGTPNLRSNRAVHYALGVEQELGTQVELGVEGFYKDLT
ncbi:MAG TPA: TonB family protein, partial [Polyangiaceae bacterium]|nr:TonB family protein [Polyangiaceae bacterium]